MDWDFEKQQDGTYSLTHQHSSNYHDGFTKDQMVVVRDLLHLVHKDAENKLRLKFRELLGIKD